MSYKGYSFNLHKEDDKELISWLNDKKITRTIKAALYNQMKLENGNAIDDNPMEILSVIKKAIEGNGDIIDKNPVEKKEEVVVNQNENKKSLDDEDVDDFEKIFDV